MGLIIRISHYHGVCWRFSLASCSTMEIPKSRDHGSYFRTIDGNVSLIKSLVVLSMSFHLNNHIKRTISP